MKRVGYLIAIGAVMRCIVEIHDAPNLTGWLIVPLAFAGAVLLRQSTKKYC
jgi:hypothetical protein